MNSMQSAGSARLLIGTILGALLALPVAVGAQDTGAKSLEALAAESASTPVQHEALAAYYKSKADEARAEAKLHRNMAVSYSSRSPGGAAGMKMHCDRLADAAQQAATEYEALAAFHEAQAKQGPKK